MKSGVRLHYQGYTMPELLITSAIVAVGINAGLGLVDLVERQQRLIVAAELQRLLAFARYEAVSQQRPITLCALDNKSLCSREWAGRKVAVFSDSNKNRRLDEGEALRKTRWPEKRGRLQWRAALGRPWLEYSEIGSTSQNGSFFLCSTDDPTATLVMRINRGGRPYLDDPTGQLCR